MKQSVIRTLISSALLGVATFVLTFLLLSRANAIPAACCLGTYPNCAAGGGGHLFNGIPRPYCKADSTVQCVNNDTTQKCVVQTP